MSFFLAVLLIPGFSAHAQSQTVTLQVKEESLESVFKKIQKQTGLAFIYENDLLKKTLPVTVNVVKQPLKQLLDACFKGQPLTYSILDNSIIVPEKRE